MSKILEQAEAAILAIIDEHVAKNTSELRARLNQSRNEIGKLHASARSQADAIQRVADERNQARAELAGVTAQRDEHLSRSVELAARVTELEAKSFDVARLNQDNAALRSALAREWRKVFDMRAAMDALEVRLADAVKLGARVTELEAKLAAATPAVDEVDGFRVGDLVRSPGCIFAPVEKLYQGPSGWWYVRVSGEGWEPGSLRRKPVEVGDTVRHINGGHIGVVVAAAPHCFEVRKNALDHDWFESDACIAISPMVKS